MRSCLYELVGHGEALRDAPGTPPTGSGEGATMPPAQDCQPAAQGCQPTDSEHGNPANAGLSRGARAGEGRAGDGSGARTIPPTDWRPSAEDQAFAAAHAPGLDTAAFAALFIQSCRAHGYRYRDHSAAFRSWIVNRWERPHARTYQPAARTRPRAAPDGGGRASRGRGRDADRSAANRDSAIAALDLVARR
jgi:hypothetical protein